MMAFVAMVASTLFAGNLVGERVRGRQQLIRLARHA